MATISAQLPGHFVSGAGFIRADQRTKQRSPTFKFGIINFGSDRRVLCVVKNVSSTGAMIELENTLELPDVFTLSIEADPFSQTCRTAWRKSKEIAVKFESSRRDLATERNERRQSPRRSLNASGLIRLEGGFATRECTIVDVSSTGVRLEVPFADNIPATFTLMFSKNYPGRRLRTTWKRANAIGAKFF
jgi:hypothetical protein